MSDKAEVIYRTEYILKMNQLLKKADADHIRDEFVNGIKSGVAFIDSRVEVESHHQPIAVILPDGTFVRLEEMP